MEEGTARGAVHTQADAQLKREESERLGDEWAAAKAAIERMWERGETLATIATSHGVAIGRAGDGTACAESGKSGTAERVACTRPILAIAPDSLLLRLFGPTSVAVPRRPTFTIGGAAVELCRQLGVGDIQIISMRRHGQRRQLQSVFTGRRSHSLRVRPTPGFTRSPTWRAASRLYAGSVGSTWDNGDCTARGRLPGNNFFQVSGVRGTRGLKRKRQP